MLMKYSYAEVGVGQLCRHLQNRIYTHFRAAIKIVIGAITTFTLSGG